MKFVAVEYKQKGTNKFVKGYLIIPENFPGSWTIGFKKYLTDKMPVDGEIKIYPLNVRSAIPEKMGNNINGYTNMEDSFNLAVRSNNYYPSSDENDAIRRQWSMLIL